LSDELLRFRRPRHQLAVEADPVGFELLPEPCLVQSTTHHVEELPLYPRVVEEAAARPSVADTDAFADDAEASARHVLIPAYDDHRSRPHVLLFAHALRHANVTEIPERLSRVIEQTRMLGRLRPRHRGRQIDQPLRIRGESAEHLERGDPVL